MSTLREQLERLTAARKARIPPDALSTIERTTEELKLSGIAVRTLRVWQRAPEFSLSDADGNTASSQELLRSGPLVVSFYRGKW
jgi:hypothetical protein